MMLETDHLWMQKCLELAKQGRTAPNPMVGAVIVKNGEVIATGFHQRAGMPHAEAEALSRCPDPAGATLYVNLEPCNHFGRTPPCTEAIIRAGIKRVVVGMIDPDPRVSGKGIERLRSAGIEVTVGVLEAECQALNAAFVHRVRYQRAFGIWKYAMTLDGKIATATGDSFWVTTPASRQVVHQLRNYSDAIITGGNTVRQDNPRLTSHGVGHNPLRVIMSRSLDLPLDANIFQLSDAPTVIFTTPTSNPDRKEKLIAKGVEIVELEEVSPRSVVANLTARGCNQVLWECGGNLAAQAVQQGLVQKVYAFIAPKIVGGTGINPIGDLGITKMAAAKVLDRVEVQTIGQDVLVIGYLGGEGQDFCP
ncbi:MAG: bifunctional diaminohydroxyphosphoribosylaminopyrimidine deaminase/5-amino-6-(5-phosphoribosylamino)uracil reductase RibD [Pseudanabaenaceae cyanobacterium]